MLDIKEVVGMAAARVSRGAKLKTVRIVCWCRDVCPARCIGAPETRLARGIPMHPTKVMKEMEGRKNGGFMVSSLVFIPELD